MSQLEAMFALHVRAEKLPDPVREHKFHPTRKFRFDFAWPDRKVAFEIDGGTRKQGRHNRHEGYSRDCIKMALALQLNWKVYRFTGDQVKDGTAIDFAIAELRGDF